jgi:hypothetical protein
MEKIPGVATGGAQKNTKSFNVFNIETSEINEKDINTETSSDLFEFYDPSIHGTREEYLNMIKRVSQEQISTSNEETSEEVPHQSKDKI